MKDKRYRSCMENRELSWLKFNERVLEEANCQETPLMERLKFLSIFTSNLDEFYMVRVGTLTDLALVEPDDRDSKTGMTAQEQLAAIYRETAPLYAQRDRAFAELTTLMAQAGISQLHYDELKPSEQKLVEKEFYRTVLPVLSPQIIDTRHPFPHIDNKQLNVAVSLRHKDHTMFGIIPLPGSVPRMLFVDREQLRYILMEEVLLQFAPKVFDMYKVGEKAIICITRNADIDADAGMYDEDLDYRQHMKKVLKKRMRLAPVRLEVQGDISEGFIKYLRGKLGITREQVFLCAAPLDLSFCFALTGQLPAPLVSQLTDAPFTPQQPALVKQGEPVLRQVLKRDILLSYPYESMNPFLRLIKEASEDKNVLSIKITLYRIARQAKLAEYLIAAAENGKEVFVLMELRARFDEQNNIEWAQRLEEAGCRVIYGMDHYKVHSKICLITRREHGRLQTITQVGTGNYNEKTAKLYTDLALITANPQIGADATAFFKNMSIGNLHGSYGQLWVAPCCFKQNVLRCIDEQIALAGSGQPAGVMMKFNSLTDIDVMEKLIEASCAGVPCQLIVRGICCLVPGVEGLTENITIISIVGRYLEHSRVYCFGVGQQMKMYISSGDMMSRNTMHRVEVSCPVYDPALRQRILHMMQVMLGDNVKARQLGADGRYRIRHPDGQIPVDSQQCFMDQAILDAQKQPVAGQSSASRGLWQKLRGLFGR